jgi:hypothetical protein
MIDDADASELLLLGPRYLCCGARGALPREDAATLERLLLWLDVERVTKAAFLLEDVLPRLAALPAALRSAALIRTLEDLPRLSRESPGFAATLVATAFVPTASQPPQLRVVGDLYDPTVEQLQRLLAPACFPAAPFDAPSALRALRALGLRKMLTREGVLESARGIARDAEEAEALEEEARSEGVEQDAAAALAARAAALADGAVARSRHLLAFLDANLGEMLAVEPVEEATMWVRALLRVAWMAVHRTATAAGAPSAPWHPSGARPHVMPPALVRPIAELWLCSHARGVLEGDVRRSVAHLFCLLPSFLCLPIYA